jgi:hypothetical protein
MLLDGSDRQDGAFWRASNNKVPKCSVLVLAPEKP